MRLASFVAGRGYVLTQADTVGQVTWIFTHPHLAGRGYGRALVHECLRRLQQCPTLLRLEVRTSQMAYRFFERFGYRLVHVARDYWAPGYDLYQMERPAGYTVGLE